MNILQKCSLVDRQRSTLITLDDLIDDRFGHLTDLTEEQLDFYILLYFNANWLPEVSNATLNQKLNEFYCKENDIKKFELVFISSDKTIVEFNNFLNKNLFIRYSLFFEDQDLKSQLCKYLNINGIPYLTIVHLTLDRNLKVVNFQADKTNVKHEFLGDPEGLNFPWQKQKSTACAESDESSDDEVHDAENEAAASNPNIRFLNDMIKKISPIGSESPSVGRVLDVRKLRKNINYVFVAFSSSTNVSLDVKLVESFVDFSKQFSAKHKFLFVYINLKPNESQSNYLNSILKLNRLEWFTISDPRFQKRVCKFYQITLVPKLIVLDIKTGRVLNNRLKQCILEYSHNFCEKRENNEETTTDSVTTTGSENSESSEMDEQAVNNRKDPLKTTLLSVKADIDDRFYNLNNLDTVPNIKFDFSNLNFNFETFDLVEHQLFAEKRRKSSDTEQSSNKKLLDESILKELNENLLDLSTARRYTRKQESVGRSLHLFYFCSNATANEIYLENVVNFLKYMQEKVSCGVRIVLVSSDETPQDFIQLVTKYEHRRKRVDFEDNSEKACMIKWPPKRLVLDFESVELRKKLKQKFRIDQTPHFSLVDSESGHVLSENLKIFILNSQLRDIVF